MAAMELDRGFSDRTGEYIVTFHAIEFGLKAFLIKCGVPEWGLREKPYGHDLVCLYNMAKQRGLFLGITDVDEMLAWINEWHHCGVKNSIRIYGAAHSANLRDSLSFGGSHHQSEQLGPCLKAPKASAASPRVRKPALGRGMAGTRPLDGMTNLRK
jgi:hypothetical protein